MLEGAKSMGAGAATISMIISILGIRVILLNRRNIPIMSMPIESMFLAGNSNYQKRILYLKLILIGVMLARTGFLLIENIHNIILLSPCGILPSEMSLLEFYLSHPHQDPEWVEYVREVIRTTSIHSKTYEVMIRDFLNTELCFATRDQISSLFQLLFYGREDPKFWIDPIDLDCILRVHLEPLEFNHNALCQVLESLCKEGQESPFYSSVKTSQSSHFSGFLNQNREMQDRFAFQHHMLTVALEKAP
jgi:hypothetical protein